MIFCQLIQGGKRENWPIIAGARRGNEWVGKEYGRRWANCKIEIIISPLSPWRSSTSWIATWVLAWPRPKQTLSHSAGIAQTQRLFRGGKLQSRERAKPEGRTCRFVATCSFLTSSVLTVNWQIYPFTCSWWFVFSFTICTSPKKLRLLPKQLYNFSDVAGISTACNLIIWICYRLNT